MLPPSDPGRIQIAFDDQGLLIVEKAIWSVG